MIIGTAGQNFLPRLGVRRLRDRAGWQTHRFSAASGRENIGARARSGARRADR